PCGGVPPPPPFPPWYQAATLAAAAGIVNIRLLKTIAGDRLHRPIELQQAVPAGLVLYPTSILLLLLLFPGRPDIVAGAWGVLAVGDGAATLAGRRYGVRKWPWNPQKTVAGTVVLALAGGMTGAFLCWWCRAIIMPPPYLWFSLGAPMAAAVVAAAIETVPIRLDDNLSVPLSAAAVLWAASLVSEDLVATLLTALPAALIVALPINTLVAVAGFAARTVSMSGAVTGAVIGTVIYVCA